MASTVVGNLRLETLRYGFEVDKDRTIRIWTPSNYTADKPLPVMYTFDGQNLFDDSTSFVGEWHIDETIEEGVNAGLAGYLVVGVDNSSERNREYIPAAYCRGCLGEKTMGFLVEKVIPYIEANYSVLKGSEHRTIAGSSLGGLMALYAYEAFNMFFSNYLIFSPALFCFEKDDAEENIYLEYFRRVKKGRLAKHIFISVGGRGYEAKYVKCAEALKQFFSAQGYGPQNLLYMSDSSFEHNEKQWTVFFKSAYKFISE